MSDTDRYLPPAPAPPPPRNTGLMALGVILGVVLLCSLTAVKTSSDRASTVQESEVDRENQELREALAEARETIRRTEAGSAPPVMEEEDSTEVLQGIPRKAMPAVDALLAQFEERLAVCRECRERLESDVTFNITDLKDRFDTEVWRDRAKELMAANQAVMAFMEETQTRFRAELNKIDLSRVEIDRIVAEVSKDFTAKLPAYRRWHRAGEAIGQNLIALCDFADKEWGKWSWEEKGIVFQTPGAGTQYNAILARGSKLADEVEAAENAMLDSSGQQDEFPPRR